MTPHYTPTAKALHWLMAMVLASGMAQALTAALGKALGQ